jgi:hypothetical protein
MARREAQPTRTVTRDQVIRGNIQQASISSLAFERRSNKPGAFAWLVGYRAGFYGDPYIWPLGALDPQRWTAGFIEGRGQRGRQ